jgi:hypothetical protein
MIWQPVDGTTVNARGKVWMLAGNRVWTTAGFAQMMPAT